MVPATSEPTSNCNSRRSNKGAGTSPSMMRCARPSTMAVLPTPGSPINAGLFFVRRARIWITRSISICRPMTGSSLFCSASDVRSVASWSTRGVFSVSCFSDCPRRLLERPVRAGRDSDPDSRKTRSVCRRICSADNPNFMRMFIASQSLRRVNPINRCSVPTDF